MVRSPPRADVSRRGPCPAPAASGHVRVATPLAGSMRSLARRGSREGRMTAWLCRLRGHQRTRIVFATNRFYCRRCGRALDPDPRPELPDVTPRLAEARARLRTLRAAGRASRG